MNATLQRAVYTLFLCTALLWAVSGDAAVYRWEDAQGRIHYSDRPPPGAQALTLTPGFSYYTIAQVYDGDTMVLTNGERVRLLGINAPEIESHWQPGEPGGEAARAWLAAQVEQRRVRLERDMERRDKYGRLLAHVFTEDGLHLNLALLEAGLASVTLIPPNLKYSQALLQAQERAERARRGIWGMAEYAPRAITTLAVNNPRGWQRYTGTPIAVRQGRTFDRLMFSDTIDIRIPRLHLELFPPLEDYIGQPLEVRGWVSRRGSSYSILMQHPGMLKRY